MSLLLFAKLTMIAFLTPMELAFSKIQSSANSLVSKFWDSIFPSDNTNPTRNIFHLKIEIEL